MERKSELSSLKNIGPKTEQWLNDFDIFTKKDIEEMTPVVIYKILKANGYPVNILLVYALQGAITDTKWNELPPKVKAGILEQVKDN